MFGWMRKLVERNEPKNAAADEPANLQALLDAFRYPTTESGITVTPFSALECPTVFACVRVLAESAAMLPLMFVERSADGKSRTENMDTNAYRLLTKRPNPWQTPYQFRRLVVARTALRGNFYAFKNIARGVVRELLPLDNDRVTVKQEDDFSIRYKVTGKNGEPQTFTSAEIFHVHGLSMDGFSGLDPVTLHKNNIALALALDRYGGYLFKNGAMVSGILSTDKVLKPEDMARVRESWEAAHGKEKQFGTAVVDNGFKYEQMSMSASDAQFNESKKLMRSILSALWRIPPHMVGDLEKATFSNIENLARQFVDYALMPWLIDLEQSYAQQLMTDAERQTIAVKHNLNALLRGDSKTRSQYYKDAIVGGGWMNRNEVRAKEDMDPADGLDDFILPLNVGSADKTVEPQPPEPVVQN